jgi:hypothetical protein
MTNAPTFSTTRLPANVMLLKNNGNTSMTACKRFFFFFFSSTTPCEFWLAQLFLSIVSSLAPYVSNTCKRLDENYISNTRCNEVITCTTPTNTRTKIMSPVSWYRARPGVQDHIFHRVLKTRVSLHYYNGGSIAKHSNFSLQRVTLSSRHVTRNFRHEDEVLGMVLQQACWGTLYSRQKKKKRSYRTSHVCAGGCRKS